MLSKRRYKIIEFLQKSGYRLNNSIQFANYYRAGFVKQYDCFILEKDRNFYFAKIGYNRQVNVVLNKEWLKTELLNGYLRKIKKTNIRVPQNVKIIKTRLGNIFLAKYYQNDNLSRIQFLYNPKLLIDILLTLRTIYKSSLKNKTFLKAFPYRNWDVYFYRGSEETYSSVKSILNRYKKLQIGSSCFWGHYEQCYLSYKDVFNQTLCLINGNFKNEHIIIKDKNKFIITDWKRSCISSKAIDYSILKRRGLEYNKNKCQKVFEIIDKIVYRTLDPNLAKRFLILVNLTVLHRVFSEFYSRILKTKRSGAFFINPLQIGFTFNQIIDNILNRQDFNICHLKCFRKTFLDIKKILLEKIYERINF